MKTTYAGYTDIGGRENNEDSFVFTKADGKCLCAVADGVGGANAGEVASNTLTRTLYDIFTESPGNFNLPNALRQANAKIYAYRQHLKNDMKTTAAAVCTDGSRVCCAHSGDTRIYLFSRTKRFGKDKYKIIYQSRDHSVAALAVRVGEIDETGIRSHPDRNRITRCAGVSPEDFRLDEVWFDLKNDDIKAAILCTDGFWEYVLENDMISALSRSRTPRKWLRRMCKEAKKRRGKNCDNSTAVAFFFKKGVFFK